MKKEKTLKERLGDFCERVFLVSILVITLALLLRGSVSAQTPQDTSSCFVFERLGTSMTIYSCDEGTYRVTIMLNGIVSSGGLLENGTPCPIFFLKEGSICYIREEVSRKLRFKAVL